MVSYLKEKISVLAFIALFVAVIFGPSSATAATVTVAGVTVPADYHTIQDALDHAASGDTVIVEDGLYKENVVIKVSVVLRSRNGSEKTIIEPVEAKNDVIKVLEVPLGVTISGFTLRGSLAAGLHIIKSPKSKVFRNSITGNNYGLQVEFSSGCIIKENVFNTNDTGLSIYFSNECLIENNVASSNTNVGILLHSSHKNILLENNTNSNVWNGITLSSSNDNSVRDNRSLKNTYAIVVSESFGNVLEGNSTMPRLYYILPVALVYLAIMLYLIERKLFMLYYHYKYGE